MQIPFISNFVNDSTASKSLNVDGSSVAKTFTYSPGEGNTSALMSISCIIEDAGTTSLSNFGSISSLTNGLLIEFSISGNVYTFTNIKDNSDLCTRFKRNHFGNSAISTLLVPAGFGDSVDIFVGTLEMNSPIVLTGSDYIRMTVRDNLSNVNVLSMSYLIHKDIA